MNKKITLFYRIYALKKSLTYSVVLNKIAATLGNSDTFILTQKKAELFTFYFVIIFKV
jgi:hypothetical protein